MGSKDQVARIDVCPLCRRPHSFPVRITVYRLLDRREQRREVTRSIAAFCAVDRRPFHAELTLELGEDEELVGVQTMGTAR